MAGETYEARDPLIIILKGIRNTAVWTLDQCVLDQKLGGAIIQGVSHAND